MKAKSIRIILFTGFIFLMTLAASAQHPGGYFDPPHFKNREKVRKTIETIKIWRLTEELNIDEKLAEKLYPKIRQLEKIREENEEKFAHAVDELKRLIHENAPEKKLNESVKKLIQLRIDQQKRIFDKQKEILDLLTPEQKAKYVVFEYEFPKQVRDIMRGQRKGHRKNFRKRRNFEQDDPPLPE